MHTFNNSLTCLLYICRGKMYLSWPLRTYPGLGRSYVSCHHLNSASWPLMSWIPASWPWLPANTFLKTKGQNWFTLSKILLGKTHLKLELLDSYREEARLWFIFTFFRDPSYWSSETMEALGPLLILDDNTTSALPNKVFSFTLISTNHQLQ